MTALLQVSDLHVAYGRVEAVTGVNLSVQAGQIVSVIGANGAGKSTLLKLIHLDERPSRGAVVFDERNLLKVRGGRVPLHRREDDTGWASADWTLRRGRVVLTPGDSPAGLRAPIRKERQVGFVRRRIKPDDRVPLLDALRHEILIGGHFHRFVGDFVRDLGRDDNDAVIVSDDDVARKDRNFAAADRNVDVDGLVQGQVRGGGWPIVIGRNIGFADGCGVPKAAIRHHAGAAALHQAGDEDVAGACRPCVLAAVHHQHCAGRAILDRFALRSKSKNTPFDGARSLGEALLEPTRIYVKSCLAAIAAGGSKPSPVSSTVSERKACSCARLAGPPSAR